MTPMIDVVFLLLIFFVVTFKIIVHEGDFNVRLAAIGQHQAAEINPDPIQIRLMGDANGILSEIQLNGENIANCDLLQQRVLVISLAKPDLEVVLIPDDHLRYEYYIKAITAVNGYIHEGQIRKICDKIAYTRREKE